MQSPKLSLAPRPGTCKAPVPSPALLALQNQGFELPSSQRPSAQSLAPLDQLLRISPLSISPDPSDLDKAPLLEPYEKLKRASSVYSADTTVTKIVHLYANKSQQSFMSSTNADEAITQGEDDSGDDTLPPPMFHQPKAYRDTVAPLLQHQNDSDNLYLSHMPSPLSFTSSLPRLPVPSGSETSLQATPDSMGRTHQLKNSLQIDNRLNSNPSLQSTVSNSAYFSFDENKQLPDIKPNAQFSENRIQSILPMSKKRQESWYDQPISPVSSSEMEQNVSKSLVEISQTTLSSDGAVASIECQRQLAYDSLCPPSPHSSPNLLPVAVVHEESLPGPISATVTHTANRSLVPSPSNSSKSPSRSLRTVTEPTSFREKGIEAGNCLPESESYSKLLLPFECQMQHKPSLASLNTVWPAPQIPHASSSISHQQHSESLKLMGQLVNQTTFGKVIKTRIKEKFNKRRRKERKGLARQCSSDCELLIPRSKMNNQPQTVMEFTTLEYPIADTSNTKDHPGRNLSFETRRTSLDGSSVVSGPGPAVRSSPIEPVDNEDTKTVCRGSLPTYVQQSKEAKARSPRLSTSYQMRDAETLHKRNKEKCSEKHMGAKTAAVLENIKGKSRASRPSSVGTLSGTSNRYAQYARESDGSLAEKSRVQSQRSEESKSSKSKRVRKMFSSSEERRRDKLKNSIKIVGAGFKISHDVVSAHSIVKGDGTFL